MSNFHKNFPFGKGMWIWSIYSCLGGDVDAIIAKMKAYDLSYVILKAGDGEGTWEIDKSTSDIARLNIPQYNSEIIRKFHEAGIKVYSWSFIYGDNPNREANIASWAINQGADGHVFDAETQYEHLSNPEAAAEQMLQALRQLNPDAFIAHSPMPIIDYHTRFPYRVFGKYCDAVMPQVYQGDFKMSSQAAVNWMYEQWIKWEATWPAESRKPIIPLAQAYDNYEIKPAYILKPQDMTDFINAVKGYKSVNFWSFQHISRNDCWDAIRDAKMTPPTAEDLGVTTQPNTTPPQTSTPTPTPPTPTTPETQAQPTPPQTPVDQPQTTPTTTPPIVNNPDSVEPKGDNNPPASGGLGEHTIPVPSTIEVKENPQSPGGIQFKVYAGERHIDILVGLFTWIFSKLLFWKKKGGDK